MGHETISIDSADLAQYRAASTSAEPGDLTPALLEADWWTDEMVAEAGIPVVDVPIVSIGGGVGSFVLADYLRIAGLRPDQLRVLSVLDRPWQTYQYLTEPFAPLGVTIATGAYEYTRYQVYLSSNPSPV